MFLSILGMYEHDTSIFKGFTVPEGVDRETCINNILLNCAELEIMYHDFDTMKLAITVWATSSRYKWTKLYETTKLVYNPIWNVDADVSRTDNGKTLRDIERVKTGSENETRNLTDQETVNLTDTRTLNLTDTETPNLTDTRSVKGFNSNTWAEAEKNVKTGTDGITHTGTDTLARTGTDTVTRTGTDTVRRDDRETIEEGATNNNTYTERRTGNIGVTTTQKMIEEERNIAEFSIINYICQSFKTRFCILIY